MNVLSGVLLAGSDPLHHNYDFPILSLPNRFALLTNHMVIMLAVFLFLLWAMPRVARRVMPGRTGTSHDYVTKGTLSHLVEVICVFFREQVARPVLGENTDRFMPLIWTTFFFILLNNLMGMVPLLDATALAHTIFASDSHAAAVETHDHGVTTPEDAHALDTHDDDAHAAADDHAAAHADEDHHAEAAGLIWFDDLTKDTPHSHFHGIGGTPTGNIAVTFALALIAITVVIGSGIRALGVGGFIHHMTLGAPVFLWPLTILLEIIGLLAKPFALMVRLFANMTAGHVMLSALLGFSAMAWNALAVTQTGSISGGGALAAVAISIGSIIFATAIGLLELLVAFIQAYIFTFLTTMFISMFQHHGHDDHHHGDEHAHGHGHQHAHGLAAAH